MVKKIILLFSIMLMFYSNSLTCSAAETWTKQHENDVNTFEKELSEILEKDNKDESDSKYKIVSFDISQAVERYDIVNAPLMIGLYNKNKNENINCQNFCHIIPKNNQELLLAEIIILIYQRCDY